MAVTVAVPAEAMRGRRSFGDDHLGTDREAPDRGPAQNQIAEMAVLRDQMVHDFADPLNNPAARQLGELVDHLGLRDGPGADLRRATVTDYLDNAPNHLNNDVARQLSDLFKGPAGDVECSF